MSLYCMKCKKWATNKKHPCITENLISVTKNMLPVALQVDSLGLRVTSAFCLTNKYNQVEARVYFNRIYPEILLQDLPNGWYLTDYITIDNKVICSCLSYEAEYIDNNDESLEKFAEGIINDLLRYLETLDKGGLMSVLTLLES